ncbi:MAG: hypothetical protein LBP98_04465 [Tannerella sp.]|jgi:hypothetical protein|nr:hypothetical protein [Tannerella sp.]
MKRDMQIRHFTYPKEPVRPGGGSFFLTQGVQGVQGVCFSTPPTGWMSATFGLQCTNRLAGLPGLCILWMTASRKVCKN